MNHRILTLGIVLAFALGLTPGSPTRGQPNLDVQQFRNAGPLNRGGNRGNAGPGIHEPFAPPVTAAKIRVAIDDAVFFLRSLQQPDGSIGDEGSTVLSTLTLLAAGADPAADDGLRKA